MICQKNVIVITVFLVHAVFVKAQSVRYPVAIGYSSPAAYSKNFANAFSFTSHQAALGNIDSIAIGVYTERRFLLEELSLYKIAVCIPVRSGGFAVSAKHFGYNAYRETEFSVGYGKNLGRIKIGVQFNYYSLQVPGYGSEALFNFEGGAILELSEHLHAGIHVFNPVGGKFGENNLEKFPSAYTAGIGYEASDKVFTAVEFIKEEGKPVNINIGLHYAFVKKFFAHLGLLTGTTSLYFGAGWQWNKFRIDITFGYHRQLGFTPGVLLMFSPGNK